LGGACLVEPQEALGRNARHRHIADREVRAEWRRIERPQAPVQLEWRARECRLEPLRQVHLVDIARGDVVADRRHGGFILAASEV